MPKVLNKFAGSMLTTDPRSLLFGARGSIFPTIPAYRYRAQSTNATGSLSFFNGDGILLPLVTALPATDDVLWQFIRPLPEDGGALLAKAQRAIHDGGFQWLIGVTDEIDTGFTFKIITRPLSRTNVDILVGSILRTFPQVGDTGSEFRLRQVVWNETMPPQPPE